MNEKNHWQIAILSQNGWHLHGHLREMSGLRLQDMPTLEPGIPIINLIGVYPSKKLDKLFNKHLGIFGVNNLSEFLEELKLLGATITYSV